MPATKHLQVVTQFYPPDYAPTGQLIAELAQQLGSPSTHISLFTSQPAYAYEKGRVSAAPLREHGDYVRVRRSRACRMWSQRVRGKTLSGVIFFIRSVFHVLRRRHSDILLLTTAPPFLPILGYLMNRLFGLPYVCLLYDLYPDIAIRFGILTPTHWLSRFWINLNRQTWRRAQAVIVLSPSMREHVLEQEPSIADRVVIIHNWADPKRIVPMPKEHNPFARQHDLIKDFTVLYSGNMGRCHDLETVIAAAVTLRNEPVKFVLIGDGPQCQSLKDRVQELALTNVLFLPYQDREILPLSLTACDLSLVSIDQRMEGLVAPSKFYSALAAGRPIAAICASTSYLGDLIDEAKCGKTFCNGDAQGLAEFIRHLYQDSDVVEEMGHSGRQYCQDHFTPELTAQAYRSVLLPHDHYVSTWATSGEDKGETLSVLAADQEQAEYIRSEWGTDTACWQSPSSKTFISR